VERVTWFDAVEFCNALSDMHGFEPVYAISGITRHADGYITAATVRVPDWNANGYRLPTEAEWEYACRAGTDPAWPYSFGATEAGIGAYAWYSVNSGDGGEATNRKTHQVGLKLPNPWGLYDMHGNVWEWVWDWYGSDYYASSPQDDPRGPTSGELRVRRGGSWYFAAAFLRSADRFNFNPGSRGSNIGFRLARP
jgi:formylglycine-generating enzyme required for sulfatase activity